MTLTIYDQSLNELQAHKQQWATLPIQEKILLYQQLLENTYALASKQVDLCAAHKKIPKRSHLIGEEWLNGPVVQCRTLRLYIQTLKTFKEKGYIHIPSKWINQNKDQCSIKVFPRSLIERLMLPGVKARVWMQEKVCPSIFKHHKPNALIRPPQAQLALVLGAGNVSSIGFLDVVDQLIQGHVVLLKMNPVNDYLEPLFEKMFKPFIEKGFVRIVSGGADVGQYLCDHSKVERIHITGSAKTHDAICFGTGAQGTENKAKGLPKINKPITSELSNVTPIIVVPGEWGSKDITFHAENIATQLVNNAGFNCLAARVLVLPEKWPLKDKLLSALAHIFNTLEKRYAYYPGALERFDQFCQAHPKNVDLYGDYSPINKKLPWALIKEVPYDCDSICFKEEAFCGLMAQTSLPFESMDAYFKHALKFCNDTLWGTLTACVIVDPKTRKKHQQAFDDFIQQLRYGNIGINQWPALSYGLGVTPWGAYPGHPLEDIQSGQGVVHNTLLLDKPEKVVIDGPFRLAWFMPIKPAWFASNKAMPEIGQALLKLEYKPRLLKLISLGFRSLKG